MKVLNMIKLFVIVILTIFLGTVMLSCHLPVHVRVNTNKEHLVHKNTHQAQFDWLVLNHNYRTVQFYCLSAMGGKIGRFPLRIPMLGAIDSPDKLFLINSNVLNDVLYSNITLDLASTISHIHAWLQIDVAKSERSQFTLVSADTFLYTDEVQALSDEALRQIDSESIDWDILLLKWNCTIHSDCSLNGRLTRANALMHIEWFESADAYLLSGRGARKLLDSFPCKHDCSTHPNGCSTRMSEHVSCMIRSKMLKVYGFRKSSMKAFDTHYEAISDCTQTFSDALSDSDRRITTSDEALLVDDALLARNRCATLKRCVRSLRDALRLYEALGFTRRHTWKLTSVLEKVADATSISSAQNTRLLLEQSNSTRYCQRSLADHCNLWTSTTRTRDYLLKNGWRLGAVHSNRSYIVLDLDDNQLNIRVK